MPLSTTLSPNRFLTLTISTTGASGSAIVINLPISRPTRGCLCDAHIHVVFCRAAFLTVTPGISLAYGAFEMVLAYGRNGNEHEIPDGGHHEQRHDRVIDGVDILDLAQ